MAQSDTPGLVGSSEGLGRCACPPNECHAVGNGPANCAAVAARQKPIAEARYVGRLEAVARLMIEAPDDAALEHARAIARSVLRPNVGGNRLAPKQEQR